jgi:hypothetical protein
VVALDAGQDGAWPGGQVEHATIMANHNERRIVPPSKQGEVGRLGGLTFSALHAFYIVF